MGGCDTADDSAAHDAIDWDGRHVRAGVVEPAAHGGIEGEIDCFDQGLAGLEGRGGEFGLGLRFEGCAGDDVACGAGGEDDGLSGFSHFEERLMEIGSRMGWIEVD